MKSIDNVTLFQNTLKMCYKQTFSKLVFPEMSAFTLFHSTILRNSTVPRLHYPRTPASPDFTITVLQHPQTPPIPDSTITWLHHPQTSTSPDSTIPRLHHHQTSPPPDPTIPKLHHPQTPTHPNFTTPRFHYPQTSPSPNKIIARLYTISHLVSPPQGLFADWKLHLKDFLLDLLPRSSFHPLLFHRSMWRVCV